MRKVKLQMQVSVDGFVASPNGDLSWAVWNWDDELKQFVGELTNPVDCILLGRKLAEGFIPHWTNAANDTNNPEVEAAIKFRDTPKVVFSRTLVDSPWENTKVSNDIKKEVTQLKNQPGGDIIIYGGASTVAGFIKEGLIDELNLFINPVAIGKGLSIFNEVEKNLDLKLVESRQFSCGIVLLRYK
ncbi:MAG TPA: dihydrofolate reductase family protein [Chitinophagaceae bacterium]